MPKDLTPAALTEIDKNYCSEPLIIVEITWGFNGIVKTYSGRMLDNGSIEGKILQIAGLETIVRIGEVGGASGQVNLTLDDTDQSIKQILNNNDIHKSAVKIYQAFDDLALTDKFLLIEGELNSPLEYSDTEKTLSFAVVTRVENQEIGFAPEEGDITEIGFVSPSAIGKAWPLCFGTPIQVPAVKLTERIRGSSLTRYGLITVQELEDLCSRVENYSQAQLDKEAADSNPGFSDENYEVVANNLIRTGESVFLFVESLLAGDETARGLIYSYIETCELRYRTRLLFQQQQSLGEQFQAEADANQVALNALLIQVNNAQNAIPPAAELLDDGPNGPGLISQAQTQASELASNTTNANLANNLATILAGQIDTFTAMIDSLTDQLCDFRISTIIVEGGEDFPQAVETNIVINGVRFKGTFSSRTFTVSEANLPIDFGVPIGQGDFINQFRVGTSTVNLKGKFCFLPSKGVILVNEQDLTLGTFSPLLMQQTGALPPLANVTLNGQPIIREIYDTYKISGVISETAGVIRKPWITQLSNLPDFANGLGNIPNRDYGIEIGDEVFLYADYKDVYVANLIPSTEILEVYAYRRIDGGVRRLLPVPTRYYTTNLSDSIAGQTPTTVTFPRPLSEYTDENWEDEIYVSLVSTEGPNTAEVIDYLLTTYSNITPETSSFTSVGTAIDAYPSNFALLEKSDSLDTVENIAWQARCSVLVFGLEAKIKYLAAEDASVKTFDYSNVFFETLDIDYGSTEDLVTKLIATWRTKYSQEDPFRVVIENNVTKYGLAEQEYNFYIYNSESLVVKSLTYWMLQYSNTWKRLKFTAPLDSLNVDLEDTVLLSIPDDFVSTVDVKGRVKENTYNSEQNEIEYVIQTTVRSGEMLPYDFAFPATAVLTTTYPTANDPFAGK